MKKRFLGYALLIVLPLAFVLLSGCATFSTNEQAVICPQCRTGWFGDDPSWEDPRYQEGGAEAWCPGCKGALMTWLQEGRWEHTCSICDQSPFRCSMKAH